MTVWEAARAVEVAHRVPVLVVGVEGLAWYRHEATVEAGGIGREFEERARRRRARRVADSVGSYLDARLIQAELDRQGVRHR